MKNLTTYKILATLFFLYVIWNYMIYFAIENDWKEFMSWHWFVGGMMIMFAGVIWICFVLVRHDGVKQ